MSWRKFNHLFRFHTVTFQMRTMATTAARAMLNKGTLTRVSKDTKTISTWEIVQINNSAKVLVAQVMGKVSVNKETNFRTKDNTTRVAINTDNRIRLGCHSKVMQSKSLPLGLPRRQKAIRASSSRPCHVPLSLRMMKCKGNIINRRTGTFCSSLSRPLLKTITINLWTKLKRSF